MAVGTNVGNAYLQIVPTSQGIQGSVSKLLNKDAGSAGEAAGGIMGKLMGSGAVKALAALGIGAAIGKVVKASIGEGSELEQNLGGLEAVFGEFADEVAGKADKAYSTMGMSASDYMATVNKMGSLFQGSGLEQVRAMELSTAAMERAADVASVMGIDTQMAMESIAGAAKGNFTMMDNLGVAMNATTLEAYALEKGMNFKWNLASNAEKAEVAMAMFMDRTSQYAGNFAREASETFSGSLNAMQAAWKNVLGNMALGNDLAGPLTALGQTATDFIFKNLIPMVTNALGSLPGAVLQIAGTAISTLITNLPNLLSSLWSAVTNAITGLIDAVMVIGPQLWDAFTGLFNTAKDYITSIDWAGLGNTIITRIKEEWELLKQVLPNLLKNIGTNASNFMQSIDWKGLGTKVITFIGDGLKKVFNSIPGILKTIGDTGLKWVQSIDWQGLGSRVVDYIVRGIKFLVTKVPETLKNIATTAWNWVKSIDWLGLGKSIINFIVNGIKALLTAIPQTLKGIGKSAINAVKEIDWLGLGKSIIDGIVSGIKNFGGALWSSLKGLASDALQSAKNFLGINSPSKVFANQIGRAIPEGIGYGVDKYAYYAEDAVNDLTDDLTTGIDARSLLGSNSALDMAYGSGAASNNYVIEIAAEIDGTELKTQVSNYTIKRIGNEQRNQLRVQGV